MFRNVRSRNQDGSVRRVGDRERKDRRGEGRVIEREWDERRESLERDADPDPGEGVGHVPDRILASELDGGRAIAIESEDLCVSSRNDAQRESLLDVDLGTRRAPAQGIGVCGRTGHGRECVEDVPPPELPISSEVELPRADAARRHPDELEIPAVLAGIDLGRAASRRARASD